MTFTRIPILGSTGIVLLQLLACSAGEPARTGPTSAPDERVDSNAGDSESDPSRVSRSQQTANEVESPCRDGSIDWTRAKWVNTLEKPRVFVPTEGKDEQGALRHEYTISARDTKVQMLPEGCPQTQVFAYGGLSRRAGEVAEEHWDSPGATFEMTRGIPARVKWVNEITTPHFLPIDPTLHWANPNDLAAPSGPYDNFPAVYQPAQSPVPIVTHVHGLEVGSASDGEPHAWFTAGGLKGPAFVSEFSNYPNSQPATTLWYHDHTLGITRLNVYAGLAGMYIIRDAQDEVEHPASGVPLLPSEEHEMPLVIQDRMFKNDGSLDYPSSWSVNHPYWVSGSGGNVFVVNGKVWPELKVDRTRYRFRMLNGANSSFFQLALSAPKPKQFTVIGADGGYLAAATNAESVRLAPGERADVLIDFSDLTPGQSVLLSSGGADVVRFMVRDDAGEIATPAFPQELKKTSLELSPNVDKRTVTLNSAADDSYLLNGRTFHDEADERPVIGSTEDWDIVNLTYEDHPIHLHLVQFKILQRRQLEGQNYADAWQAANGNALPLSSPAQNPDAGPYLRPESEMDQDSKEIAKILATETGWKDTAVAPAGFVTTIRVRWAPQDAPLSTAPGKNPFAQFDPTVGPGYVWHCHMLEHEDNDMMRPLLPRTTDAATLPSVSSRGQTL